MQKYVCDVCGYIYDPEVGDPDNGVAAGTAFADIPEDWVCPLCGVGKDQFSVTDEAQYIRACFTQWPDIPAGHNRRHEKTEGCFPADENAAVRPLEKRLIWQLYLTIL